MRQKMPSRALPLDVKIAMARRPTSKSPAAQAEQI
jgi:hypothetical protein